MSLRLDHSSVEELNLALRLYRRLLVRLPLILVLGFAGVIVLSRLSTVLSPPYGVYLLGQGLETWGLLGLLALLFAELWWEGRQIGKALNHPGLLDSPIAGLLSGLHVIGERAAGIGMEPGFFHGPLRPIRRR